MSKHKLTILLLLLLSADGIFSFIQHLNMPLDGDMSSIILPAAWYSQVLESPLGLTALMEGETYGGANRFFSHWAMSTYFKTVPFVVQNFSKPINSLYISAALIKTMIQIGLILMLASYISCTLKYRFYHLLFIGCMLFPFFQVNGFYVQMGIIDQSITYAFFYAFPLWLTLIWFYPFYKNFFILKKETLHFAHWLYLIPLAFIICFSGPLVQPIVLLVCPICLLYGFIKNWQASKLSGLYRMLQAIHQIPKPLLVAFVGITIIALYAYYIGTFNVENISNNTLALSERYVKLLKGLVKIFTIKLGFPILFFCTLINLYILRKRGLFNLKHPLFKILVAIGIFAVLYLWLLPLGGYRSYRPYIIRYDTFMPLTLLFISYGVLSTCYVLHLLKDKKMAYMMAVVGVLLIFQLSDTIKSTRNNCEQRMLNEIAAADTFTIKLSENCRVLGWHSFKKPNESKINAEMLYFWKVTNQPTLYYYE